MIPVALPSVLLLVLLLVSLLAAIFLTGWAMTLALSKSARRAFHRRLKTSVTVLLLSMALTGFFLLMLLSAHEVTREVDQQQAARHITLTKPTRLGGVDMPAGSKLLLDLAGDMESFSVAEFPHPVSAYGVEAISLNRAVSIDYDDKTFATKGSHATSVAVKGQGSQNVQGWRCNAAEPIQFALQPDGRLKDFDQCQLDDGNQVGDIGLPKGATVRLNGGTTYGDGFRDDDYWKIQLADNQVIRLFHLPLKRPRLMLDKQRRLLGFDEAGLACETTLGPMTYPAGTSVQSVGREQRGKYPGTWVFSPATDKVASYQGHADVPHGMSVLQTASGEVAAVMPSQQAGVFFFAAITVDGAGSAKPSADRCP
ncbi:hypothetical protein [Dyella silvatica]|uniref:hypothetical protein n=1 Tax=Dyella silvatica TaxID=2992128 RepID=UPI00224F4BD6|nr:hypothetical protein [Dyella silvatica]